MPEDKIKITPAKGRPMLYWVGKRPLDYVKGFPAQLIEVFGPLNTGRKVYTPTYDELKDNWQNLLFHGDNKEVLATLLELGFRGKIDLIYIDPPFKSGADYVRRVELRGLKNLGRIDEDSASVLQQTMYFDIWNNDNYLQFMYERLMLLKELLSETGSIYVHLDWHVGHYLKIIMDEVFGEDNFINEIIWFFKGTTNSPRQYADKHDTILFYAKNKNSNYTFNADDIRLPFEDLSAYKQDEEEKWYKQWTKEKRYYPPQRIVNGKWELLGKYRYDVIDDVPSMATAHGEEYLGFATQKKEGLLEIFIKASSNPGDLVLDCFIGSGTTAAVAQKLGRRWIGCDINKGAVQLTSSRLQKIIKEQIENNETKYPSFAIYKVNNYDLKLLQTEAIELAVQHIGIQRTRTDRFFDGTLGKNLVKIIDFNHPLTLLDLQLLQDELKKRPDEDRDITIVCLGKELAVDAWIEEWK
jgi:DNA modification methylase